MDKSNNINSLVDRLFYNNTGQFIVSALFGVALALVFHRVCKDNCIVFYAPQLSDIKEHIFELEGSCYKYTPHNVKCDTNEKIIQPYNINVVPDNKLETKDFITKIFG
jgi:hypothetical protein